MMLSAARPPGKEETAMLNRRRMGTLMLCIGLVLVLFVSSACLAHEAGHDCIGEGCEICAHIAAVTELLHSLMLLGLVLLTLWALQALLRTRCALHARAAVPSPTPIRWKVRLNN